MTGPFDGSGSSGSGHERRQLPPELDPRRSAPRRGSRRPQPAASRSGGGSGGSGGGPTSPRPPSGSGRQGRWQPTGVITRWSNGKIAGVLAVTMVVTLGLGAVFGDVALNALIGGIKHINPFCNSCDRPTGGAAGDLNILVVGSDSRAGLSKSQQKSLHVGHDPGQRSDTMILLHIPKGDGKATLVNLPRDSYVTIPAHRSSSGQLIPAAKNKLNAAYSLGGPKLTIETVEANTGVRIDHYIEINFLGFVKMVKALGGVSICSPTAINDPIVRNPVTGAYSGSGLVLPKGTSTLNGDRALEYVRAREFDPAQGDLGRIQRQQKFMAAMIDKARSGGVLFDPLKLAKFLGAVTSSITTDKGLGKSQILRLAEKLHSMSPKNVSFLTVPLSNTAYSTPVGSAVLWDPVKSRELFADFTNDKPITNVTRKPKLVVPPSEISLTVLNASGTNGAAAAAAQKLTSVGFGVSSEGDAPSGSSPSATVVLYGPSRAQSAATVVAAIPGATKRKDPSLGSHIELLVGSSFSTVHSVKIHSSNGPTTTVTTAATNPCH
jgi:LCP family protein required for cell wall assembly